MPNRAQTATLIRGADGGVVKRTTLPGGLRVITEYVPGVRSVALGVWVAAGSRDEPASQMGSAHFLEHLLFKGTESRDAMTISAEIESVGGDLNAFTTKEHTCYHARVLDEHLPMALDVVCDVVLHATLTGDDIEAERSVIFEEIAMYDDEPGELVHDEFALAMFGDSPLGRPILGTVDTITALPQTRFVASTARPTPPIAWLSRWPETSTMPRSCAKSGRCSPIGWSHRSTRHRLDPYASVGGKPTRCAS